MRGLPPSIQENWMGLFLVFGRVRIQPMFL